MEIVTAGFHVLQLLGVLCVPQLLGVLCYLAFGKKLKMLAHILGALLPPVLFFYFGLMLLFSPPDPSITEDEFICGTGIVVFGLFVLFFSVVQLVISSAIQFTFYLRQRAHAL